MAKMQTSTNNQTSPGPNILPNGVEILQAKDVKPPTKKLNTFSAVNLYRMEFDELKQPVYNFICEGLTLLVGASKIGKSWLVLMLCICVAAGIPFLGRITTRCVVLYLALEDSERRLKTRIEMIGLEVPENLHITTTASMLDNGLLKELETWMIENPDTGLIVIDTFQKIRGLSSSRANIYQQDYQIMGLLKAFADKHHIALVLVHHTNKGHTIDPYERISGSTGLMGAADTSIIIDRERGSDDATVHITGRDVWGDDFTIRLINQRWTATGENAFEHAQMTSYENDGLVKLAHAIMNSYPAGTRMTYAQLLNENLTRFGEHVAVDGREVSRRLKTLAPQLIKRDGITVEVGVSTTGGKGVRFNHHGQTSTIEQPRFEYP